MTNANGTAEAIPVDVDPVVTEVEAAPPQPAPPPAPSKLDESDILRLENAFLKIENLKRSREIATRDVQSADMQIQQQQQSLLTLRENLSKKYGVDLARARILPDGTLVPNANFGPGPQTTLQNPIAQALGRN